MAVKKDYPRLRQQGPRYYYDHGGKPRKWEPLGKDWDRALIRYNELQGGKVVSGNTVGWLINRYLGSRSGLAANTMKSYRNSAAIISRVFESCPLHELKRGHVLDFVDRYPKKQMARNAAAFLRTVCAYGLERELLQINPLAGMALKGKSKRDRYLTDGEFLAIREKLKPVYQVAADLAYLLGLRVSGVVTLRFSHIKDGVLSFHPPKSKKAITYQLSDEVKSVIERARTLPGSVRGLTVICNRNGSPINEITVSRAFSEGARKAGIEDVRFHDIRAKSASDEAGTAQGRLGHSDARTTDGYLRKPQVVSPIRGIKIVEK
jgi:integrase